MKRSAPWVTAALQLMLLLAAVAYATPWREAHETPLPTPRRSEDVVLQAPTARPLYHGSVVLGGVYSADELRAAVAHDAVVAAHYRGATISEMHPVTLTAGRAAYVSYRVNDRIYWTRERVWIRAGETVLTDGQTVVRARCGNCISDRREGPVAAVDPAHGELDDFVVPPLSDSSIADAAPGLGDLLETPFGPQVFATLAPAIPTFTGDDAPSVGMFPLVLPPGVFFPGRAGPGVLLPGPTGPGGVPTLPPVVFVPPGGTTTGTTSGDTTDGNSTGGSSTDGTIDGHIADTTDSTIRTSSGGTGDVTVIPSDGSPTTENPFPTTRVVTTGSASPPQDAPEPDVLWLLACGAIGVASRRWRR